MLDKIIHKHLDQMDEIQNKIDADISLIMENIDIDAVIENPHDALSKVADTLSDLIEEEYLEESIKQGIEFSKEIARAKKITVSDSSDPKENNDKS
jgi:hypothetical protein